MDPLSALYILLAIAGILFVAFGLVFLLGLGGVTLTPELQKIGWVIVVLLIAIVLVQGFWPLLRPHRVSELAMVFA